MNIIIAIPISGQGDKLILKNPEQTDAGLFIDYKTTLPDDKFRRGELFQSDNFYLIYENGNPVFQFSTGWLSAFNEDSNI